MPTSGATAALRGYRRQTLYALSRIIQGQPEDVFQLELHEDFAVVEPSGEPLEIMQVKDYSSKLQYGTLEDFFLRTLDRMQATSETNHKIISFGSFGSELREAWANDGKERRSIRQKLLRQKRPKKELNQKTITEQDVDRLFNAVELVTVDESDLEKQVYAFLQEALAGGQPMHASELLQKWLLDLSEKSAQISHHDLLNRLANVGRYLRDRELHHDEWFTTIKPLVDSEMDQGDIAKYREDFYQGISARFHHILSDVDVIRPTKLKDIRQAFEDTNVVIVHGASGQGKSTLVYRYMRDYVPTPARFEVVSIENLRHARSVATALLGHFEAIGSSMYVTIDVEPGNTFWAEVVKELASHKSIKLLIAVREEDFQRIDLPQTALGLPKMIELRFNQEEASQIYQGLIEHEIPKHILSFEDAWNTFGASGPLLEFIYLVTQNESLRDRLEKQVKQLESEVKSKQITQEEFKFLRIVASASAYATRLDLRRLVQNFNLPAPRATVRRYEKEYLLRVSDDGRYVDGLHPLRSQILGELLNDDALQPWIETVDIVLATALESDLEVFLLHSFSRQRQYRSRIIGAIFKKQVESWFGSAGILRALLWLCVDEHVRKDRQMLDDMIDRFNSAWWLTIDGDIVGISESGTTGWLDGFKNPNIFSEEFRNAVSENRHRIEPRDNVFVLVKEWLRNLNKSLPKPASDFEWNQFSYFAFWLGFLKCGDAFDLVSKDALRDTLGNLPLELLGNLIFSLSYSQEFMPWFSGSQREILDRFQQETNTFLIEDDGELVRIHFLIDLKVFESNFPDKGLDENTPQNRESSTRQENQREKNIVHSETVRRVELLHKILPHRSTYGSKGYGHLGLIELPIDDYDHSIKNISRTQFLPARAQQINGIYRGLALYSHRLSSWSDYAKSELELRQSIVKVFPMMQKTLENHFKKKNLVKGQATVDLKFWQDCVSQIQRSFLLPQFAVDEWGFVVEGQAEDLFDAVNLDLPREQNQNASQIVRPVPAKGLEEYWAWRQKWSTSVKNFLNQSFKVFVVESFRARSVNLSEAEKDSVIAEQGLNQNLAAPAAVNISKCLSALPELQNEFRSRFGHFCDSDKLERFEAKELRTYEHLWSLWFLFHEKPKTRTANPLQEAERRAKRIVSTLLQNIKSELKALNNECLTVAIVESDVLFEEKKALWIKVDSDPLQLYSNITSVIQAIRAAFGSINHGPFQQYLVRQKFEQVCLLPMCNGKLITAVVNRVQGYVFFGERRFSPEKGERQEYLPLPKDTSTQLGFAEWEHPYLKTSLTLSQSLRNLHTIVAHLSDLSRLDQELLEQNFEKNDDVMEILQPYVQHQGLVVSNYAQNALDTMAKMIAHFNEIDAPTPSLYEIVDALEAIQGSLFASSAYKDGQIEMKVMLGDMPEWLKSTKKAIGLADGVLLVWLDYLSKTKK